MTEFFVLEPVAVDEQGYRVPEDLPREAPERDKLENPLLQSQYRATRKQAIAISLHVAECRSTRPRPQSPRAIQRL
jgi:hypothetical protein